MCLAGVSKLYRNTAIKNEYFKTISIAWFQLSSTISLGVHLILTVDSPSFRKISSVSMLQK